MIIKNTSIALESKINKLKSIFQNKNNVLIGLSIFFVLVRLIMILNIEHAHDGDAISRLNGTMRMFESFTFWPERIWLPFPYWVLYIVNYIPFEWYYIPRLLVVAISLLGHVFLFRLLAKSYNIYIASAMFVFSAFSLPYGVTDIHFLSEPFYLTLVVVSLFYYIKLEEERSSKNTLILSFCLAASLLTRYEAFGFVFLVGVYSVISKKFTLKELVSIYLLPFLASLYVFYMNYQFGEHILWGVVDSDVAVENIYELGLTNLETRFRGFFESIPGGKFFIGLGFLGILLNLYQSRRDKRRVAVHFLFIILGGISLYKLYEGTLVHVYRYHLLFSYYLIFSSIYLVFNITKKRVVSLATLLLLLCYSLYFQNNKLQVYVRKIDTYHPGLLASSRFYKSLDQSNIIMSLDKQSLRDGYRQDHTLAWGHLTGVHVWSKKVPCIPFHKPYRDDVGSFELETYKKCLKDSKTNHILLFENGFIQNELKRQPDLFIVESVLFEHSGYKLIKIKPLSP